LPKPRRVQVAFAEPIAVAELTASPEDASRLVDEMLWPEVEGEFKRLRARPGLIAASLAALGIGGGLLVRRGRRPPPKRRLRFPKGVLSPPRRRFPRLPKSELSSPKRRRRSRLPWRR
jgi:1-acyl-sn-glycerol-3-phosphate acyltransferase